MKRIVRHLWSILPVLLLRAGPVSVQAENGMPLEYQVKAACLYNFAKFIDWPDADSRSGDSPFEICIIGINPFGNFVKALVGRNIGGHMLQINEFEEANVEEISKCRVAFVHLEPPQEAKLLFAIKNKPIVTVSDDDPATVLRFQMVDGQVKFIVNLDAANATGVKISSQLLKLAVR